MLRADPVFRGIKAEIERCHREMGANLDGRQICSKIERVYPTRSAPSQGRGCVCSIPGYRVESKWTGGKEAGAGAGEVRCAEPG